MSRYGRDLYKDDSCEKYQNIPRPRTSYRSVFKRYAATDKQANVKSRVSRYPGRKRREEARTRSRACRLVIIPDGTLHNTAVSLNADGQGDARRRAEPSRVAQPNLGFLSAPPTESFSVLARVQNRSPSPPASPGGVRAPRRGASSSALSVEWLNLSCIGGIGTLPG